MILFNTCSIRESADNRFIAHLGEAKRLKSRIPGPGRRRRRLLGAVGQGRGLPSASRSSTSPSGPGQIHKLAEFLTSDSLTAQGYFEFEDFSGHLPAAPRARVPGLAADLAGLQLRLLLLHRALDPRARGQPRPSTSSSPRSSALAADGVREVTLLGQNVNSYGRDLPRERAVELRRAARPGSTRSTGSSASATRARTRRTCART